MSERNQDALGEVRDELEAELRAASHKNRSRNKPIRWGLVAVIAAFVAGSAGIAIAASDEDDAISQLPPPALQSIGTADGESIEFECQAQREWFLSEVSEDTPAFSDPDAELPHPPSDLCE